MATAGNPHTSGRPGKSTGNSLSNRETVQEQVTDPTLGNGDGTYEVGMSSVRTLQDTDDVMGVKWSGTEKVTVDSVSANAVTVLFEEPDGAGAFTTTADGGLTGTLTVNVIA